MFGLENELVKIIRDIVKKYPNNKFVIFGSRARGDFKYNSDIDIAVLGSYDEKTEFNIRNDFDLIVTYYTFDIVFYENINEEKFKESIDKEGVEL